MKKLSIVTRARIAEAIVDRLLSRIAQLGLSSTHATLVEHHDRLEQDVMIVLDQKRWWKS